MPIEAVRSSDSSLKKPLTRRQSIGVIGGLCIVLLLLGGMFWFRQSSGYGDPAPTPLEVPAVVSQGVDEPTPQALPTPSSHEEAVRREKMQALRDGAGAPVSSN